MALSDIIRDVRNACHSPNSSRQVVANLMFGKNFQAIVDDEETHRIVMRAGLNQLVRSFLKRDDDQGDDDHPVTIEEQLTFWPTEEARELVRNIGETRVFVPSRAHQFVELRPDCISPEECVEAGMYLKQHAEWVSTRGDLLIELGNSEAW